MFNFLIGASLVLACISSIFWFMPFVYISEQMHQSGEHIGSFAYLILVFPCIASILLFFRHNFVASIFSLAPLFIAAFLTIMFREKYGYGIVGILIATSIQAIIPAFIYHVKTEYGYIKSTLFMLPMSSSLLIISVILRSQNLISREEMFYIIIAYVISSSLLVWAARFASGFLSGISDYQHQENP